MLVDCCRLFCVWYEIAVGGSILITRCVVLLMMIFTQVLYLALSPDGQTVCSGAADETLRLWECFTVAEDAKKKGIVDSRRQATSKISTLFSIR